MTKKNIRFGKKLRWQSIIDIAIRGAFVLLIGLAFANQQVLALSVAQKSRLNFHAEVWEPGQKLSPADTRVNYPTDADSKDPETFESDERESCEERGDEFNDSPIAATVVSRIAVSSAEFRLLIDHLESERRVQISLYILHHSWKSFLY